MAFRFRRSIKIAPGIRVNFGKKGGSLSVGGQGGSLNFGSRGVYSNVGIPGTGLNYRSKIGDNTPSQRKSVQSKSSNKQESNYVQLKISLALQDDGSVTFKDTTGKPLSEDFISQAKRQNREFITNWLEENCQEINQQLESLINIHFATPPYDTEISFVPATFDTQQPMPPSASFPEQKPESPALKEYGFLAKRIEFFQKLVDKKNNELQQSYRSKLERWEAHKADFEAEYFLKLKEYQVKLEEYNREKSEFSENQARRKKFIEEERLVDPKAMQEFLVEAFQNIVWPRETNVSFDVVESGKCVLLDVDLPEIEDMPEQQAVVNKKDLRLTYKDISETQIRKNYFTHIHAIGFRLLGEVFVSLPSVATVVLSGYSQRPDKRTGNIIDEYLYSVRVTRDKWESLDFSNLEAIEVASCFESFDLQRKATKTGVMTPIEPFRA